MAEEKTRDTKETLALIEDVKAIMTETKEAEKEVEKDKPNAKKTR